MRDFRIARVAFAAAGALLIAACSSAADSAREDTGTVGAGAGSVGAASVELLPTVTLDGSNGVMPLMQAMADVYVAATSGASVQMGNGLGSRARLDSLRSGHMDIAMASHGLDTAALTAEGLMVHRIAETPVVVGVHAASVAATGISRARLCEVLAGRVRNWRELGGADQPITVVMRPENEVDTEVLRAQVACARDLTISPAAVVVEETSDMAKALAETPGALGITTATVAVQSNGAIRAMTLDGVEPGAAAVQAGDYTLVRSSFLITRGDAHAGVERLLAFVRSPAGAAVLEANGSVGVR